MNRLINLARELAAADPPVEPVNAANLVGLRIVGVEAEAPVALLLGEFLTELGCQVLGMAMHAPDALSLIHACWETLDGAVLDGDVEDCDRIVKALRRFEIPFILTSASLQRRLPHALDAPLLMKPYSLPRLRSALRQHIARPFLRAAERPKLLGQRRGLPASTVVRGIGRRTRHG